jgi:hypothetical protein
MTHGITQPAPPHTQLAPRQSLAPWDPGVPFRLFYPARSRLIVFFSFRYRSSGTCNTIYTTEDESYLLITECEAALPGPLLCSARKGCFRAWGCEPRQETLGDPGTSLADGTETGSVQIG